MGHRHRSHSTTAGSSLGALFALAALTGAVSAQESALPFDAAQVVIDEDHRFERLVDLNGDGVLDAVDVWQPSNSSLQVFGWLNDGAGRFTPIWARSIITPGSSELPSTTTAVGDLDGDGLGDSVTSRDDKLLLLRSTPLDSVETYANFSVGAVVEHLALADFDADGNDDLLVAAGGNLSVYRNAGLNNLTLLAAPVRLTGGAGDSLRLLDANDDGELDVVEGTATEVVIHTLVDGIVQNTTSYAHGLPPGKIVAIPGDVDGDGDEDVAVFQHDTREFTILRKSGRGLFNIEASAPGGPATDLADVNGDGIVDGVCCGSGGGGGGNAFENDLPSRYEIALNDGSGAFDGTFAIENIGAHRLAGAADIDGDGDIDLVGGRTILFGRGPITAPIQPTLDVTQSSLVQGYRESSLSDLDDDGDIDLHAGVRTVAMNNGRGELQAALTSAPLAPAGSKWSGSGIPGDFDGDGDTDLLITRTTTAVTAEYLETHLLLNNGSGVFSDAGPAKSDPQNLTNGPLEAWTNPLLSVVKDVDGDGDVDIACSFNEAGLTLRVWLNDGSGQFELFDEWSSASLQAADDFDNDGQRDMLLTTQAGPAILYGLPGGGFDSLDLLSNNLSTPSALDSMAVLDINLDGKLDLVGGIGTSPNSDHPLAVFRNQGGRVFTFDNDFFSASKLDTSLGYHRVSALDLDDDGLVELIASPAAGAANSSWIFRGIASGILPNNPLLMTFEANALADLDGDGDDDVIARHPGTNQNVMVRNTHWDDRPAQRLQYGDGHPGTADITPILGATGPFRSGEVAVKRLRGGPPGAPGLLIVSLSEAALPGTPFVSTTAYAWPIDLSLLFFNGPGEVGVAGSGKRDIPYLIQPTWAGLTLYSQGFWLDAGAVGGKSATNGLSLRYE